MSPQDQAKIVRGVEQLARAATDKIAARWTQEGMNAPTGATNPYRPGSFSYECWARGAAARVISA